MRKKTWIKILRIGLIAGMAVLAIVLVALWHKPLGPALDYATTETAQGINNPNLPVSPIGSNNDKTSGVAIPTPESPSLLDKIASILKPKSAAGQTLCNGPSVMTLLLIGSDERTEGYLYGLSDAMRIVRIDFSTPQVTSLDIPRDLWVEIPDIADHYGVTHGKLNQAYFFGNSGMGYYDGPGEGPGLLARTLQKNFGVTVDHYLAVDMKTFVRLVDAVGGIDIKVSSKIDLNELQDGANPKYVFEPGTHHLDGQMALKLAMNRYPTTFQRARYQNIVLRALQDKLLTPAMIPQLPQLFAQFTDSVQTDLSLNDISKLACISHSLTEENTSMLAFPEDIFTAGHVYDPYRKVNTWMLQADFNQLRSYFADFINGTWP
jgi:LCP family protein required for cell wall assembly